ncbi:MAG: hypothetical protein J6S72_11130 [Lachnospiraceae bacterium]|nr:hypothetical protein [Lachnospiraceae bacterium]MBP5653237.1 hypothetical protein [Lachnospiraceae bacterium]
MDFAERREIEEAVTAADEALYHLYAARKYLDSAGNWGLLDLFGGGLISGIVKHSKMSDAENEIEAAKYALQHFSKELRDVTGYSSIHISEFLSFADFFFDGFLADVMVQSKIHDAKAECDDAIRQVENIRAELADRLR